MKKNRNSSFSAYIKENALLLVSTCAALCLFVMRSKLVLLAEAAIFAAVAFTAWLEGDAPRKQQDKHPAVMLLAADFAFIGVLAFVRTVKNLLPSLPIVLPIGIALVGAVVSYYAFYRLAGWMDRWICALFGADPANRSLKGRMENLLLPVSALAFFLLESRLQLNALYLFSMLAAAGILVLVAARADSLWRFCGQDSPLWVIFWGLSSAGICWFQQKAWQAIAPAAGIAGWVLAIAALFFIFVSVSTFWRWLRRSLRGVFSDVSRGEWILYGAVLLAVLVTVTAVFFGTDAFYATVHPYDIIYTSDSHILVQDNAYLWLTYEQNDLRQPLFAVFTAPFLGLSYLVSNLLSVSPAVDALLMNYPQILLLFLANFLLAKMLKLTGWKRAGFLLLLTSAYPVLLFSFMMEQYIAAYFYLILFLYSVFTARPEAVAFCGAGSTLLTSVVTLPLMSGKDIRKDFKGWFHDMLSGGIGFVIMMLAFSRLDIILNAAVSLMELNRFAGEELSLGAKLCQYTAFIPGCLWAPAAEVTENMWGNLSWQLVRSRSLNLVGIGIMLLCVLSAVVNRRDKVTLVAAAWAGFSIVVLLVLGWGTQENGLILYALYFGWAFLVLLYRLAEFAGKKLSVPHLAGVLSVIGAAVLLIINIPAMAELIAFALEAYPL